MSVLNLSKTCLLAFHFHNQQLICSFIFCSKIKVFGQTPQLSTFCSSQLFKIISTLTLALQSCLLTAFMNATSISTALCLVMLFLTPEMLSIYRTQLSNHNLSNHSFYHCVTTIINYHTLHKLFHLGLNVLLVITTKELNILLIIINIL